MGKTITPRLPTPGLFGSTLAGQNPQQFPKVIHRESPNVILCNLCGRRTADGVGDPVVFADDGDVGAGKLRETSVVTSSDGVEVEGLLVVTTREGCDRCLVVGTDKKMTSDISQRMVGGMDFGERVLLGVEDATRFGPDGRAKFVGDGLFKMGRPATTVPPQFTCEFIVRDVAPTLGGGVDRHQNAGFRLLDDVARDVGHCELRPVLESAKGESWNSRKTFFVF